MVGGFDARPGSFQVDISMQGMSYPRHRENDALHKPVFARALRKQLILFNAKEDQKIPKRW